MSAFAVNCNVNSGKSHTRGPRGCERGLRFCTHGEGLVWALPELTLQTADMRFCPPGVEKIRPERRKNGVSGPRANDSGRPLRRPPVPLPISSNSLPKRTLSRRKQAGWCLFMIFSAGAGGRTFFIFPPTDKNSSAARFFFENDIKTFSRAET